MKRTKMLMGFAMTVLVLAAVAVSAYATPEFNSPAEVVAGMTNRSVEDVVAEKQEADTTYGSMAKAAGILDEFKARMLETKKAIIAEMVADGTLTQDQADAITKAFEERQSACDGRASSQIGKRYGACFGKGTGMRFGDRKSVV